MVATLFIVYALFLFLILCYSFAQLSLLISRIGIKNESFKANTLTHFPKVTIQLPVFNEELVLERLIKSVCGIDYPKEKLHIQLLDDSTDSSAIDLAKELVQNYAEKGFNIDHVLRTNRTGFKAGALKNGLLKTDADFIAVFDSDFMPKPDYLKRSLVLFNDDEIGMVQSRWGHLNKDFSLMTKLQAFGLDAHFLIEQSARLDLGAFINFNGTAGIWRKTCIQESGNWQADTLTEDLDLSYRAQLNNWKFAYLEDNEVPAELPVSMPALKKQQFRWSKGAAECWCKNLSVTLRSNKSFGSKMHAIFHLGNSFVFVAILFSSIISVPLFYYAGILGEKSDWFKYGVVFLPAIFILMLFYAYSFWKSGESFWYFFLRFPFFLSISMGLSVYNAIGVMEAYFGKKSSFIRTPKFNVLGNQDKSKLKLSPQINWLSLVELLMGLTFVSLAIVGVVLKVNVFVLLHITFGFGLLFVSLASIFPKTFAKI